MADYSRRQFTFTKDRLPAMAGVIQHYQAITGDVPILGLWEKSFPQDLLWARDMRTSRVEDNYRNQALPSWTWLSCPTPIQFDPFKLDYRRGQETSIHHVKLVEWTVEWTSESLTSTVSSTRLQVRGLCRDFLLRLFAIDSTEIRFICPQLGIEDNAQFVTGMAHFDSPQTTTSSRYTCLLLCTKQQPTFDHLCELILLLLPGKTENTYRRVGIGFFECVTSLFREAQETTLSLV